MGRYCIVTLKLFQSDYYLKANSHDAICGNNLLISHSAICSNNLLISHRVVTIHTKRFVVTTADIASCDCKNRTNFSQLSQRNEVVTTWWSYKLLLQIVPFELALTLSMILFQLT